MDMGMIPTTLVSLVGFLRYGYTDPQMGIWQEQSL